MNYGSSNAQIITEENYERAVRIKHISCAHRRSMIKQKLCGVLLIAAALFAVAFAEDMELVLGLVPVGAFLILSKKLFLTFKE